MSDKPECSGIIGVIIAVWGGCAAVGLAAADWRGLVVGAFAFLLGGLTLEWSQCRDDEDRAAEETEASR